MQCETTPWIGGPVLLHMGRVTCDWVCLNDGPLTDHEMWLAKDVAKC